MKVYYPYGGIHYLLEWSSYNEGGHVVVSKTEAAMLSSVYLLTQEYDDVKFPSLRKVNVVQPSIKRCEFEMAHQHKMQLNEKADQVLYDVRDILSKTGKMPAFCNQCPMFPNTPGKYTYCDCEQLNCFGGLILTIPVEQFVNAYYDKYITIMGYKGGCDYTDKKLIESKADHALESDDIWGVVPGHGIHASQMTKVYDGPKDSLRQYSPGNDRFYFIPIEDVAWLTDVKAELTKSRELKKQQEMRSQKKYLLKKQNEEKHRFAALKNLFLE